MESQDGPVDSKLLLYRELCYIVTWTCINKVIKMKCTPCQSFGLIASSFSHRSGCKNVIH